MKKQILLYSGLALTAIALMAFSGPGKKKYLVTREWMSDAYLQIRPTFYNYDDQGRVTRSEAQNPDTFVSTTSYMPSAIIVVSGISTSNIKDTIRYNLSGAGLATADNRGNTFAYNTEGKLVSGIDGEAYTWSDGDMTSRQYFDGTKVHNIRYTYTSVEDSRDYGDAVWGTRSSHLVETVSDPPNVTTHRYTFDALGRVTLDSAGANIYHYFYRDF
ncbi:MAG: hypothetical protein JWO03_3056 [Bacteroidetes bacterium]|nr:hypothetical protein [Bacteroidota bacterium]